jgi:uncharacterized protein YqeY
MSLFNTINDDIKKAMLAKEAMKLEALRAVKSALLLARTEKAGQEDLSEDTEMKVLQKLVKQRKESADIYIQQNRSDLAQVELDQANVIEAYLPKQLGKEELENALKEIITQVGAVGTADMGKVMGLATKQLAGKAEGRLISQLVKELLNK